MADYNPYIPSQQAQINPNLVGAANPNPSMIGNMYPSTAKSVNIQSGPSPKEEWVEYVEEVARVATFGGTAGHVEKVCNTCHAFVIDGIVCAVYHAREYDDFEPKSDIYYVASSVNPVQEGFRAQERPINFMVHGEDTARQMAERIGRAWAAEAKQAYELWISNREGYPTP
jgi:hypothetical protein